MLTVQPNIDNFRAKKFAKTISVLKLYLQYNTSVSTSEKYLATLLTVFENHPKFKSNFLKCQKSAGNSNQIEIPKMSKSAGKFKFLKFFSNFDHFII